MSCAPKTSAIFAPSSKATSSSAAAPAKKPTIPKSIAQQSTSNAAQVDPVITNNNLYSLLLQVKEKQDSQERTNKAIFKEIDGLKSSKKPIADHTPLIPKALSYGLSDFTLFSDERSMKPMQVQQQDPTAIYSQRSSKPLRSLEDHDAEIDELTGYPLSNFSTSQGARRAAGGNITKITQDPEYWYSEPRMSSGPSQAHGGTQQLYLGSSTVPPITSREPYSAGPSTVFNDRSSGYYQDDDIVMEDARDAQPRSTLFGLVLPSGILVLGIRM